MKWLTDRIFINYKTTLLGLFFMCTPMLFVYMDKATLTEAAAFIFVGFVGFLLKDKK